MNSQQLAAFVFIVDEARFLKPLHEKACNRNGCASRWLLLIQGSIVTCDNAPARKAANSMDAAQIVEAHATLTILAQAELLCKDWVAFCLLSEAIKSSLF
jgi:hypothetical protein